MRFPLLFSLALAACGLGATSASAQVIGAAGDLCQTATIIQSGQTANGTLAGAADDIPGLIGCQLGSTQTNYPEVWYTFVATGPTLSYQITSLTSGDSLSLYLLEGPCANLTLRTSDCGVYSLVGTQNNLTQGQTYYLAITATSGADFTLAIQLGNPFVFPAQDCNDAVVLNNLVTINQGPLNMGAGLNTTEVDSRNSCWGGGGERQPKWYRFTAGATGLLEFNINPLDPSTDYDWAVWDVTTDAQGCTTKGSAIACNWTGAQGATGLSSCPTLEPGYLGGDQFDNKTTGLTGAAAPITVEAGHVYALLVDNFSQSTTGYDLTFGGVCVPRPGQQQPAPIGLGAGFTTSARPGMTATFSPAVSVSNSLAISYHWSFGDGGTSTLPTPTHTYATAGTYFTTLEVTDLLGTVATYARSINVTVTGLADDVARAIRLTLSPNPAQQQVRLTLAEPSAVASEIQVYNALGRLVRTVPFAAHTASTDIDLNGLRAGVYSVRVGGEVRRLVVNE